MRQTSLGGAAELAERPMVFDDFEHAIVTKTQAAAPAVDDSSFAPPGCTGANNSCRIGQRQVADESSPTLENGYAFQISQ
jgi:hypothetical protein